MSEGRRHPRGRREASVGTVLSLKWWAFEVGTPEGRDGCSKGKLVSEGLRISEGK